MDNKRPRCLNACIIILIFNAVITETHNLLIFLKIIPIHSAFLQVVEFSVADTLVTAIPSFLAAYGLWCLKKWGWIAAMIGCGGYLHGMASLLTRAIATAQFNAMNIVSIYFIVFSFVLIGYLWQQKKVFI